MHRGQDFASRTFVSAPMGFGSRVVPFLNSVGMLFRYCFTVGIISSSTRLTVLITPPVFAG